MNSSPVWDPEDYAANSSAQFGMARLLMDRLELEGGEEVLDIGCGDGKITVELARRAPRGKVVGIDASREMIAFARTRFPAARYPHLDFVEMDASAITFEEKFDLVFSNAALHWLTDHGPTLLGISRALKPGGRACLQMAGKGNFAALVPAVIQVIGDPRWRDGFKNYRSPMGLHDPETYRAWLLAAGLQPVRVELVTRSLLLPGREGMIGWVRTTWHHVLDCVPSPDHEIFISALVDAYLAAHPLDPQGVVTIPSIRLEVEAQKPLGVHRVLS